MVIAFFNRCAYESVHGNFFAYIGFLAYVALVWPLLASKSETWRDLSFFLYRPIRKGSRCPSSK